MSLSSTALRPHVPAPGLQTSAGTVAAKEALLQHPASFPQAALEHAVRHNDIPTARQALQQGADPEHLTASPNSEAMRILLAWVRRKNLFYPPNAPHDQETDLDRALRNMRDDSDLKEACTLLRRAIDGRGCQEAWQDAVKNKRLDIQRAILLLYADRDRNFRLLEEDPVTDEAVAKVMKEIPYFSPKRGWPEDSNAKARFPDQDEEIVCRHLVEHRQAVQEQSEQLKFNYAQYASKEAIAAHVSYDTQAKYLHLKAHAAQARLFHNSDFGKTLVQQLDEMTLKKETARLILLESTTHAMSVGLKIKEKDGKTLYVAELFDPNHTTSHVRVASDHLHTFKTLTLKSFIDTEDLYKGCYPEPDELSMMFVRPSSQEEQVIANPASGAAENRTLTSSIEDKKISATVLFYMLSNGFAGNLRRLKKEIANHLEEKQIQLLAAKNAEGVPGLLMALYDGHTDAIRAFGELLKLVPQERRAELLAAKDAKGIPGLWEALKKGHANSIKAFGELLELVSPKERANLLATQRTSDGLSGLDIALEKGHLKALEQYIEIVKKIAPDLKPKDRAALLKYIRKSHAVHKKGIWWVNHPYYEALKKNNPDFYRRFKEMKNALKSKSYSCL